MPAWVPAWPIPARSLNDVDMINVGMGVL